MPKKTKDEEVGMPTPELLEQQKDAAIVDAELAAKEAEEAYAKLLEKQAAQEAATLRAHALAKAAAEEQRNREFANRTIWVVVQQRRDRPVRLGGNRYIQCRTPVQVNRHELRRLEGLRQQGVIQLVVGELEKPGAVEER